MNGFSTETALCTMKVTNFSRLSKLIAKNTPDYVLGEHRTVGVDVGGSLGKVPCSEELARQIQGPGVSTLNSVTADQKSPMLLCTTLPRKWFRLNHFIESYDSKNIFLSRQPLRRQEKIHRRKFVSHER